MMYCELLLILFVEAVLNEVLLGGLLLLSSAPLLDVTILAIEPSLIFSHLLFHFGLLPCPLEVFPR